MKDRWDKCKCGKKIYWDAQKDNEVVCKNCETIYYVDSDSVLVYWLTEKIESPKPWTTEAR